MNELIMLTPEELEKIIGLSIKIGENKDNKDLKSGFEKLLADEIIQSRQKFAA